MIMIAVMLPMLVTLSGLAMGVIQLLSMRTEVVSVTDASAHAAAESLSRTGDIDQARAAAVETAALNSVAGQPVELDDQSVEFGTVVRSGSTSRFERNSFNPNAVRVTASFDPNVAFVEIVPSMLKRMEAVEIVRSSIFAETDRDIALVIDRSSSMGYDLEFPPIVDEFSLPTPLGELPPPPTAPAGWSWCGEVPAPSSFSKGVTSVIAFLAELGTTASNELVMLATFATKASIDVPLTGNYGLVVDALQNRELQYCGGGSDIAQAITTSARSLIQDGRPFALKSIILLTDNIDETGNAIQAAEAARSAGVVVHTISLSATSNSPEAILGSDLAEAGGGFHRHASDLPSLIDAFLSLAKHVPVALVEVQP